MIITATDKLTSGLTQLAQAMVRRARTERLKTKLLTSQHLDVLVAQLNNLKVNYACGGDNLVSKAYGTRIIEE